MSLIKGIYEVHIAGTNITSRIDPFLLSLSTQKSDGQASDTASVTLADPNGILFLPNDRADVAIHINGLDVFTGFVDGAPTSNIDKGSGRTLEIAASSIDQGGKAKEPRLKHKDDASIASVAKDFGSAAGITMKVAGSISSITRKYWIQQNESFVSWGQRIAKEIGGTFKIVGDKGFLTAKNEGLSVSGKPLTQIHVTGGEFGNLLSGSIKPMVSRPKFKKIGISYFDVAKGEKVEVDVTTPITDVETKLRSVMSVVDKDQAKEKADALSKQSDSEQGQGSIEIIGDEAAEPGAEVILSGYRDGVDGTYRANSVSHSLDKSGGFVTSIELRQPKGGAGKDGR